MGVLIDRVHRELTEEEISRITKTYHDWRGGTSVETSPYKDVAGFCKSATWEEIKEHGYVLTPGRYVGAEEVEEDDEPFAEKMERLTATLAAQFTESARLEAEIRKNLQDLGYRI
jgi:type I restriction enzyme M protein